MSAPAIRFGLLALVLSPLTALRAQTAEQLLTQARRAFENLDFEQAARLYTRMLDPATGAALAQRDTAQLYLGVSYQYASQPANAVSAFRTLLRSNPCVSSPEAFGAGVTAAFVEARGQVFAAGLCGLGRQELAPGDTAVFSMAATRPAAVRVLLQDSVGQTAVDFGERPVAGISPVRWSPLPSAARFGGRPARYLIVVRARALEGTETDERVVPVLVSAPNVDTVPHPPPILPSAFRPERRPAGPALGDLAKGLGFALAIAGASSALTYSSLKGETGKAVAVGGGVGLAGTLAFGIGNSRRDIPENRTYNADLRRRWESAQDSVVTLNRQRLASRRVVIEPRPEER